MSHLLVSLQRGLLFRALTTLLTAWLSTACRSTPLKEGAGPAPAPPACPAKDAPDPLAAWSSLFPVEQGGVVEVLKLASAEADVRRWQASLNLQASRFSPCNDGLAVWIPAVSCPIPTWLDEGLSKASPILFGHCFSPMHSDEIVDACARGSLTQTTCAAALPPIVSACRPAKSERCSSLQELAARFAADAR